MESPVNQVLWYVEETVRDAGDAGSSPSYRLDTIYFDREDALAAAEEYVQGLALREGLQVHSMGERGNSWHVFEAGGRHYWITIQPRYDTLDTQQES